MSLEKNKSNKTRLHPRNRNRESYDLIGLSQSCPSLKAHIKRNKYGVDSVDFSNPVVVKLLNKAILKHYYGIENWDFPDMNLCPPIPGRADYIHQVADLLSGNNKGMIPKGDHITCLDVGVGASCIYPIIGLTEYGWTFIGSDIDPKSIASARDIVNLNASLKDKISCRLQENPSSIFQGVLRDTELIDVCICNPPFHSSVEEAQKGTRRKIKNLSGKNVEKPELNFAGITNELVYKGGELQFVKNMIRESQKIAKQCFWFTSLVSKESNLRGIYKWLKKYEVTFVKTIPMGTGNKSSRIIAWTFLSEEEQNVWKESRWKS